MSPKEPGQIDLSFFEQTTSSSKRISGGQGFKFVNYSQQELKHQRQTSERSSNQGFLFLNLNSYQEQTALNFSSEPKPASEDFTFVNSNGASQQEKERNRSVIRSEIMKRFWRRSRTEWKLSSTASCADEPLPEAASPSDTFVEAMTGGFLARYSDSQPELATRGLAKDISLFCQAAIGSPSTPLGAGSIDPFNTYPHRGKTEIVPKLVDYQRKSLYPVLAPSGVFGKPSPLITEWLRLSMIEPLAFYSILWGSSLHFDIMNNKPRLNDIDRMVFKSETIRILSQDFKDPATRFGDNQLLAMFILATHDSFGPTDHIPDIFPVGLSKVGWLNIYWRMLTSDLHIQALFAAIDMRGGLETIKLVGLAEIIFYGDIMEATRKLSHPRFPILSRIKIQTEAMKRHMNLIVDPNYDGLGSGFLRVESCDFFIRIKEVVIEMSRYTAQIDSHMGGTLSEAIQMQMLNDRNIVHHGVMSLPTAEEILRESRHHVRYYYEPCRLALLIYSAAVVFPTPAYTGTYKKLANRLHDILKNIDLGIFWHEQPELLVWIWVLGGMAAVDQVERGFFVASLARVQYRSERPSWEVMKAILMRFLWLDSACDPPGKDLWGEVRMAAVHDSIFTIGN